MFIKQTFLSVNVPVISINFAFSNRGRGTEEWMLKNENYTIRATEKAVGKFTFKFGPLFDFAKSCATFPTVHESVAVFPLAVGSQNSNIWKKNLFSFSSSWSRRRRWRDFAVVLWSLFKIFRGNNSFSTIVVLEKLSSWKYAATHTGSQKGEYRSEHSDCGWWVGGGGGEMFAFNFSNQPDC